MADAKLPPPAAGQEGHGPDGRRARRAQLLRRLVPGIAVVSAQVQPYADHWLRNNESAVGEDGPLWVVLGDSMSQGVGASTFEGGWVPQAATLLAQAGRPYRVINLSRTSATTADVLQRQLPELAAFSAPPSLVTLLIGANDMFSRDTRHALRANFSRILDQLPRGSVVAYLPQPVKTARAVNALIDARARSGALTTVNLRPAARRWRGHRAPDLFHPNQAGYARIARCFTDAALRIPYP